MKRYAILLRMTQEKDLSIEEQQKIGTPIEGAMDAEHAQFLETLQKMIREKTINPEDPQTFLNPDIYKNLDEKTQDKADLALQNMARQVQLIHGFLESNKTPDQSPQLQTMVDQLWKMKNDIEIDNDVFVF